MKLQTQFITIFFSIIFISLVFLGGILYKNAERILTENTLKNLKNIAHVIETRVNDAHARYLEHLRIAAHRMVLLQLLEDFLANKSDLNRQAIEDNLRQYVPVEADLEDIYIYDRNGDLVAATAQEGMGQNVSEAMFFKQGLKGEYMDFRKRTPQDKYAGQLILSTALIKENSVLGVIVVLLKEDILAEIAKAGMQIGETEDILLGRLTVNGDSEFIAPRRFEDDEAALEIIPKDRTGIPMTQALAGREVVFDRGVDYRGHIVLATTKYIESFNIGLVVKIDRDEFLKPIRELKKVTVVFGGIILFFTLSIALVTARSLSEPIRNLSLSANRIASGDLSANFKVEESHDKDEVDVLADSLMKMAEKLIHANQNLESDVRTRTQELEKRLAEVELFNKITSGRELQMIELKKQINALSKQLNLKEPYNLSFLTEKKHE